MLQSYIINPAAIKFFQLPGLPWLFIKTLTEFR